MKEAVKLMLFAPLAASLGKRLDQDAEVRIGVLFLHPETAHETEGLMGGPALRQPGKRKRGQTQASRRSQTGESSILARCFCLLAGQRDKPVTTFVPPVVMRLDSLTPCVRQLAMHGCPYISIIGDMRL